MQKINLQKTNLFVLNSQKAKKSKLARIIGCKSSKLPSVYLGMPFFEGRIKASYWEILINKIQRRLAGWKSKILSYVGRLNLIKHTLLSIPIYLALVFKIPTSTVNKIDRLCREFLWSGKEGKKKFALVAWKIVYRDKKEGGLGISHTTIINEALKGKMSWILVIEEDNQWIDICRRKYLKKDNPFLRTKNLPYRSPFQNGLVQVQKNIKSCIT